MFPFHALAGRNPTSSNRGSAVKHLEHVLSFPQDDLAKQNRFDYNNWTRVVIDDNEWNYQHDRHYRNMTLADASKRKDVEYDFIDDVGFNESKWDDGCYAKLQYAIAFASIQEREEDGWRNQLSFYLIQLFQSGIIGKGDLKEILKSRCCSSRLLPLFYEMYVPESLWNYIMGTMKNIIDDIIGSVGLTDKSEAHYRKVYAGYAYNIVTAKDVMMMIFAQEKQYPDVPLHVQYDLPSVCHDRRAGICCPLQNSRCNDRSDAGRKLRRMYFPRPRKAVGPKPELYENYVTHLKLRLKKHPRREDSFNFHFFMATFMASIPNDYGKKIRNNNDIMVLIERLVPPENLFTEIEEAREKIRLEKNKEDEAKKGKLGHDNLEPESKKHKK